MTCPKCKGTGWFQYSGFGEDRDGTPHSQVCDACCNHEGEPWLHDSGDYYCLKGCGTMMRKGV